MGSQGTAPFPSLNQGGVGKKEEPALSIKEVTAPRAARQLHLPRPAAAPAGLYRNAPISTR